MQKPDSKRLLRIDDVAEAFNVSPRTVRRMVAAGEIPFIDLPRGGVRFDPAAIANWVETRRDKGLQ